MECRICGGNDLFLYYKQGDNSQYRFYKCKNCRLINLDLENLWLTEAQQKYVEDYKPPLDFEKVKGSLNTYTFVSKFVKTKGNFLDIGCGYGSVLYFFRKFGWNTKGLELSEKLANFVSDRLGIEVEVADFLKFEKDMGHYDLVSIRQVLEHLPDSILALNRIYGLLKDEGYAYFEFPNIEGLSHKLQRTRNKIGLLKKKYDPNYHPGHCNEFSKYSFEFLLKETGFKLICWETYSRKPLSNMIYNNFHFGTKARAIVQKISPD